MRSSSFGPRSALLLLLAASFVAPLAAQSNPPVDQNSTEPSLGDVARKLRADKAKAAPAKVVYDGTGISRPAPEGFKQASASALAVFVPNAAIADEGTATVAHYHVLLDNPKRIVMISFGAAGPVPPGAKLETIPPMLEKMGMKVLGSEQKSINGNRAIIMQVEATQKGMVFREFQTNVVAGSDGYAITCGTRAQDFASIESICRTVIESASVQ